MGWGRRGACTRGWGGGAVKRGEKVWKQEADQAGFADDADQHAASEDR